MNVWKYMNMEMWNFETNSWQLLMASKIVIQNDEKIFCFTWVLSPFEITPLECSKNRLLELSEFCLTFIWDIPKTQLRIQFFGSGETRI